MVADVDETSPLNPSARENQDGGASYQSIAKVADSAGDVAGDEESATRSSSAADLGAVQTMTGVRTIVAVLLVGVLMVPSAFACAITNMSQESLYPTQTARWSWLRRARFPRSSIDYKMLAGSRPPTRWGCVPHSQWQVVTLYSFEGSYILTQLQYGKLSDIYGRKPLLLVAYALFAAGCLISWVTR
ncbi:uncharacterized protein LDX57_006926 [Aspergillus melleus]|uniref:uncharacterized protein n=1 Tax=Aspergillus melleus TaxID=138277 RepID=UPI001E8D1C0A|nr:uncharacterized protein LDX57_006926 [Aspergillus melleus]KAH8429259.1 hypothetical protein LDX57_006926 [Aspergillus melleus]